MRNLKSLRPIQLIESNICPCCLGKGYVEVVVEEVPVVVEKKAEEGRRARCQPRQLSSIAPCRPLLTEIRPSGFQSPLVRNSRQRRHPISVLNGQSTQRSLPRGVGVESSPGKLAPFDPETVSSQIPPTDFPRIPSVQCRTVLRIAIKP